MIDRPIRSIARSLGALSKKWLAKNFKYRRSAVKALKKNCGYSQMMADEVISDIFSGLSEVKLWRFLKSELGNPEVLDKFCPDRIDRRQVRAFGPGGIVHILPSQAPQASVISVFLGLLTKSRNLIKLSSGDSGLLREFLKSLRAHDRALADACSLLGGSADILDRTIKASQAVIVYGNSDAVNFFHKKIRPSQTFIAYGHRMSFGVYLKGSILDKALALKTAKDLWLMDQGGCLSPLVIYIREKGGRANDFCSELTSALRKKTPGEQKWDDSPARIHVLKNKNARYWRGGKWTVLYDESPLRMPDSWGGRTVYVRSFDTMETLSAALENFAPYLQAATLEGSVSERQKGADLLANLGFNRICPAGRIQKPPLSWHHDGRLNLAPLLRWTDLE